MENPHGQFMLAMHAEDFPDGFSCDQMQPKLCLPPQAGFEGTFLYACPVSCGCQNTNGLFGCPLRCG